MKTILSILIVLSVACTKSTEIAEPIKPETPKEEPITYKFTISCIDCEIQTDTGTVPLKNSSYSYLKMYENRVWVYDIKLNKRGFESSVAQYSGRKVDMMKVGYASRFYNLKGQFWFGIGAKYDYPY